MRIAISDNAIQKESYYSAKIILLHYIKSGQDYIYGATRIVQDPLDNYDLLRCAIIKQAYLDYRDDYTRLLMEQLQYKKMEKNLPKRRDSRPYWDYEHFVKGWEKRTSDHRAKLKKLASFFYSPEYDLLTDVPGEYLIRKAEEAARKYVARYTRKERSTLCRN